MRITEEVREAIRKKCQEEIGGARKLALEAGFTPAQISRYHLGRTTFISEACWTRLFPHIMRYLPDGFTCKVLDDGKPVTRMVRHRTHKKIVCQWENEAYVRLFGRSLPTRERIEELLTEKIRTYDNEMALLILLLNFDEIMENLADSSPGNVPEKSE